MEFNGVEDDHFDDFMSYLKTKINLTAKSEKDFTNIISPILSSKSNEWVQS